MRSMVEGARLADSAAPTEAWGPSVKPSARHLPVPGRIG